MPLPDSSRRAYLEARYRSLNGTASPGWRGDRDEVTIWMDAFGIAETQNISPWDALLVGVKRRAARVQWVDQVIGAVMTRHVERCKQDPELDPEIPPGEVRTWLNESRQEERLLARQAKMAIDAGVAVEMVRRTEMEGRVITDALIAGLDALPGLTQDQRIAAITAMHNKLAGNQALPSGHEVIDVDPSEG